MPNNLPTMTPELRAAMNAKSLAARAAKTAARRASPLRRNFADAPRWDELASEFGTRLPPWGEPCTPSVMRRFLNRVKRSGAWWIEQMGGGHLDEFARLNPDWPARAWAGLVLEAIAREKRLEARA